MNKNMTILKEVLKLDNLYIFNIDGRMIDELLNISKVNDYSCSKIGLEAFKNIVAPYIS